MTSSTASALAEPFDPALLRRHEGKNLTYVPISEVIARLNRVLGVGGWSYKVNRMWGAGEQATESGVYPAWVMAHVTLTASARGVDPAADDPFVYAPVANVDGVGGQQVKLLRNGSGVVDLGDEYKGAVSDALKKAAQHLGVGLELARKDEAIAFEAAQAPPPGWDTRTAFEETRASLRERAQALPPALGDALKVWWKAEGLAWPLTPAQADTYAARIAGYETQDGEVDADGTTGAPDPQPVQVSPSTPPSPGVDGAALVSDLADTFARMDRAQLKAVRAWAVAQGLPIDEGGRPDLTAIPPDRLEALYTQVAAA